MNIFKNIEQLKQQVIELYERKHPDRADWCDWLYENHIFLVADFAHALAIRVGANPKLVSAASILHDIADALMKRENFGHEAKSLEIAEQLLPQNGFSKEEIEVVVNDALRFHGCKNGQYPKTIEGRVFSTADAMAHLRSSFYNYALSSMLKTRSIEEIKKWALPKIERDYKNKIFFEDIRIEFKADYDRSRGLFMKTEIA
jgi:HD superfamily phosphodiesterase